MTCMRSLVALLGVALSPASCFPKPEYSLPGGQSAHEPRDATKTGMPAWKVAVISLGIFLVLTSVGFIGGALEYALCTSRKKSDLHGRSSGPLDDSSQDTRQSSSPHIGSDQATLVGDRSDRYGEIAKSHEKSGRYSWQDDKGITTEVYMDGAVPGAGPATEIPRKALIAANDRRYEEPLSAVGSRGTPAVIQQQQQQQQQQYRGAQYMPAAVVSPISPEELEPPQFVVHDEQDDHEYQQEMATHPGRLVGYFGSATTVSPIEPEATGVTGTQRIPWEDRSLSPQYSEYGDNSKEEHIDHDGIYGHGGLVGTHDEADDDIHEQRGTDFEPWLPTVDLTIDEEPQGITLVDHEAQSESKGRPSVEGMWKTHPTQFL